MILENIGLAAIEVFELHNLMLMLIGVFFGIIAGAIPGFTVTMAVVGCSALACWRPWHPASR